MMTYTHMMPFLIILNLFLAMLILWALRYRRLQRCKRQALGLSWLQRLRVFLSAIQQHRGLTTGYLNGSVELEGKIREVQHQVSRNIAEISSLDPWMEAQSGWQGITQHWARLSGRYDQHDVDNNLIQHNKLIQNILYLIDDMAQEHDLLLLKSHHDRPLHFAWRELLTAAECIGQARAMGTGVVAAAHCDTVSRIRLNYLCQKIEHTTRAAWSEMPPNAEQKEKRDRLLECINQEIIIAEPSIGVSEFFEIASAALDSLHEQYDAIVEQLR